MYCTINDRFALCPECAEKVRLELTTLTPGKIARGAAGGAGMALVAWAVSGGLAAAMGAEASGVGWVLGLGSVFMGTVVGRAARRSAKAGGLALQIVAIAIAIVGVVELYAPLTFVTAMHGEKVNTVFAAVVSLIISPIVFFVSIPKNPVALFFLFWAIYDPWRACAPFQLSVRGPFPVQAGAPPPGATPAPPTALGDAKAAGLDFERPA